MAADRMILGQGAIYSTDSNVTGLNNNVIVCAGSGCGKTTSITETRFLEAFNSSLIVPVTKRRIIGKYAPLLLSRGYRVKTVDFVHPENSDACVDLLQYVTSYADIRFLAESIVTANPRKERSNADPYWDQAATSLLCAEIAYTLMHTPKATLTDVLKLHDRLKINGDDGVISTSLDQQFEDLEERHPNCYAANCWESFKALPIRTAGCVYSTLNVTLDALFEPELREMIATKPNLDLEEAARRRTVIFIVTSAVNPALNAYVHLFYGQAFRSLFEYAENLPDGRLPLPVQVICDDFATGAAIVNFDQYISIFREKGLSVILLLQSESQLKSLYTESQVKTIINNCDSYVYMGGMDIETAQHVSIRMNIPVDDVLSMPIGDVFIFRRGQKPLRTQRYDIFNDRRYQQLADNSRRGAR